MANTKKNDTTSTKENKTTNAVVDAEKERLKEQLAKQQVQFDQMKTQMETMMKMIGNQNNKQSSRKEKNITFVNLTTGTLVLKGSSIWTIEGQFESRVFLEREARLIVNNMPNLFRSGAVYITDAEFVEENELGEAYQHLITDEQLKNLLNHDASFIVDAYKNASKGQKEIIVDLITNKKLNGESVDANVLVELGKISGKDLMSIEPLSEDEE